MGKIIDRTGEVYKGLKIIEELGGKKVRCECIECNHIDIYTKGNVLNNKVLCSNCKNGNLINRTGEIYNNIQIIEELGEGKINCKCIKCNHIDKYFKNNVVHQNALCRNCGTKVRKNRIGEIHRDLKIIEEPGGNEVKCECVKCGYQDTYSKQALITNQLLCKNCNNHKGKVYGDLQIMEQLQESKVKCNCKKCGHTDIYNKQMVIAYKTKCKECGFTGNMKDKTGEVHRGLQIIKELGGSLVICKCIECGYEDEYNKHYVLNSKALCKQCKGDRPYNFIDKTGETYGTLKIIKELGNNKVLCSCTICNNKETYTKTYVTGLKTICKFCERIVIRVDRTGEIHRNLKVIKELGNQRIDCECLKCGHKDEYDKKSFVDLKASCKNCGLGIKKDRTGEIFAKLEIIKELGGNRVICKCSICDNEDNYEKSSVIQGSMRCKKCGIGKGYKGVSVKDITILDFAYTGRDGQRYYKCICNKCKEELLLTKEEIIEYKCTKG